MRTARRSRCTLHPVPALLIHRAARRVKSRGSVCVCLCLKKAGRAARKAGGDAVPLMTKEERLAEKEAKVRVDKRVFSPPPLRHCSALAGRTVLVPHDRALLR